MKLSTRARYALRLMVDIAKHTSKDEPAVSLNDVARRTHISRRYLEQLAIALKNASIIKGKTGKGGGYMLARPAGRIKAYQIIEAAIGPINIVDCVQDSDTCDMSEDCECRSIYCDINDAITDTLKNLTLKGLVSTNGKKKKRKKAS